MRDDRQCLAHRLHFREKRMASRAAAQEADIQDVTKHMPPHVRRRIEDFELRGITDGPEEHREQRSIIQLRVMPDYCSSGIWATHEGEPFHSMVEHADLGLPASLAARFAAWQDLFDSGSYDETTFNEQGRVLATELKRFVDPSIRVVYGPPDEDEDVTDAED